LHIPFFRILNDQSALFYY